ncbi:Gamma-glutamyl hydrolase 2 [Striga hermonthica]|uniref:folate gamma-glutamyl hydrolase n=1 Tax=Striga hermonthica TaxID=68872 RepID=A0A9N7MZ46_STRHE|nr:Gamma-glutamyl hydrolase 2 [Striga hermonthica]
MAPPPPPPHNPSPSASDYSNSASAYRPPIPLSSITAAAASSSSSGVMNYLWIPLLLALSKELAGSASADSTASVLALPSQAGGFPAVPRCPTEDPSLNFRPVIGILSHPGDGASGRLSNDSDASYIAASYVKFVESAGARVIPLIYNEPSEVLNDKLKLVNGVILTGGRVKTGLYFKVVESIFKNILKKNDGGDHFPLLAICLGFELLTMIVSEDQNILENFNAVNQASTLQFIDGINLKRTVFQRFPPPLLEKLRTECLVMQNHRLGISPVKFQGTKNLSSFFEILTTSTDQDGKVYVSTVQADKYPVTAVQWHPEKNAFEWGLSRIPHSEDAVEVTQLVANFIVREARKSMNRPSPLENKSSWTFKDTVFGCTNGSPVFSGILGLNKLPVSLISQIRKSVRGQYSYCLHQAHGYLRFGDDIPKIGKDVKTTSILHHSAETMFLELKDISVAGKRLGISTALFSYSQGGFFVDTGTQLTILKRQAYDKVMKAFANFYDVRLKRASKKIQHLDLCYKQNSTMSNIANMTFHLQGADYVPSHMYVAPEIGIMCIGILPGELSILGVLQQFNKRFVFDINNNVLKFVSEDCSKDRGQ